MEIWQLIASIVTVTNDLGWHPGNPHILLANNSATASFLAFKPVRPLSPLAGGMADGVSSSWAGWGLATYLWTFQFYPSLSVFPSCLGGGRAHWLFSSIKPQAYLPSQCWGNDGQWNSWILVGGLLWWQYGGPVAECSPAASSSEWWLWLQKWCRICLS